MRGRWLGLRRHLRGTPLHCADRSGRERVDHARREHDADHRHDLDDHDHFVLVERLVVFVRQYRLRQYGLQ
jgi:hypothetical protein